MNTYQRNAKVISEDRAKPRQNPSSTEEKEEDGGVRINGFQQVLELLEAADPEFRASLLKRMEQRDPALVYQLKRQLSLRNN